MMLLITILICINAIVSALFYNNIPWIIIGICDVILVFLLLLAKSKKLDPIESLSDEANALIREYGHFYAWPRMCIAYGGVAAIMMFCGIIVAGIGAFRGWWWGAGLALINYVIMGYVSRHFNPTKFIKIEEEIKAHDEILKYKWGDSGR